METGLVTVQTNLNNSGHSEHSEHTEVIALMTIAKFENSNFEMLTFLKIQSTGSPRLVRF